MVARGVAIVEAAMGVAIEEAAMVLEMQDSFFTMKPFSSSAAKA